MKLLKSLVKYLVVLLFGLAGGMLWQTILLPYLAETPRFQHLWFVEDYTKRQVNLYPLQEITIVENEVLTAAVDKIESSVVSLKIVTKQETIIEGSGFVLTSDGLIVTLNDLLPRGSVFSIWVNNKKMAFEITKRDPKNNLALIKIRGNGFSTCSFADLGKIKKGQRVFLVGHEFSDNIPIKVVNQGIIRHFDSDLITTNMVEKPALRGSGLFDIEASVLGINMVGFDNEIITIPISKIQSFAFE